MELEKVFNRFPKNQTNILLRHFNAKLKKNSIFTRNICSVSLHEYGKKNVVYISKICHIKIKASIPHSSHIEKIMNTLGSLLLGGPKIRLITF